VNQVSSTIDEDSEAARPAGRSPLRRRLFRWTAIGLGTCAVLIALLLIGFQMIVARAPEYRVQLQDWLSEKTQLSIEFNELSARLRFYGPELAFADVTVRLPDRTRVLATARGGSVAFDLWNSLRTGRLTTGRFTLDSPQIGLVRTRDGRIQIAGQGALIDETKPFAIENLPVGKFRVRGALVSFQDQATGRGPWTLSGVSFTLARTPSLLRLEGTASLPTALGEAVEFSARVAGALETPQEVESTFTLNGAALDLTGWADVLPDRWPAPESGRGTLALTASFVGPELRSITAEAQFKDLTASTPAWTRPLPAAEPLVIGANVHDAEHGQHESSAAPDVVHPVEVELPKAPTTRPDLPALLSYARVHLKAHAERGEEGWQLQIGDIDLDASEAKHNKALDWQAHDVQVAWSTPQQGALSLSGKADVILLQSVAPLLAYLPESGPLAHLRALNLRGTLRNVEFSAQRTGAATPLQYSVSATTDAVGFDPVLKAPGFTGISGVLETNEKEGKFRLDSGPLNLSIPWMFRWPIDTNAVRGVLTWRNDGDAWQIETNDLTFDANDGKGEARLAIRIPKDGSSPQLDISAQARDMNAASTPKYLPANHLGEQALAWLDRAFVSGRVPSGSLELHGPTRSFPFRKGEGQFLVEGVVEGLTFDYQEGWTPATQLAGHVEFRNEGMHASGVTARVGDLQVTSASGGFEDFKVGDLKLTADANGDLGAALGFLQTSPIGAALGEQFQALRGNGSIESRLSLLLPITHVDDRRLSVATKLTDATVRLADLDAPVTQLNGSLIVRQELPVEADLKGQWLGGAVDVLITPDDRTDQNATLVARGQARAAELAAFLPPSIKIDGAMDWRMSTRLSSRPDRARQVYAIDSSLQGLGVQLPYPAGKDANTARPLHVELEQGDRQLLARAALGDLRGLLRFQASGGKWVFDRGGVRADGVLAALPVHPGLRLEGSIDHVRLDDWFALGDATSKSSEPKPASATKVSDILRAANLHVGVLQLYGYEWPDVRGVMQATDQGWRVDVTGANAEGQIFVPEDFTGTQPLVVDLERLVVLKSDDERKGDAGKDDGRGDPREWPSMRVHVGDMHFENHPIGGLDLLATRVPNGLRIDSVKIAQDAVQAEAHGDWSIGPAGERSSLVGKITSTDVRATLRALNYTEFLDAKRAEVSAQLAWPGGFDGNLVKRASGTITVSAESGQLLMLQPGAGRVLGLFSVAALPRRLSLDFSDLTEKGLSFDTIHGDFELREGNAYTSNLLLRGPAAEIGIAGRTGLGAQDFDQTAVVTGNLGASIPVAGALAGGPAVGAALLLFSQVFKEPLKGIARGYYRISGTWDEPIVERVDAAEAKERG
jgi:uncharacterized protein (TIGR02099 family)